MISPGMFIADRYEIIEKVGSGGMADVYKAKCHKLNRFVAIKVLKQEFSTDESFVDKFRAEAQSAAGLSHPNIVNVYDVGEENGTYYIVMELIEGITLKNFIERKGRLDVREATGIAIQIAQGLEAAHANNIIHRDIKPQNIIISKDGKVKVADFGIAKAASSNTLTSSAMGSVHYISPEQARGGYSDEKSDIYSLGITIYEMLLGKVPFEGDNAVSIALLHIQEEATPLGELLPDIPISINKIVIKCLQKKPERRYLAVSELTNDLKRSLIEPNVDFVVIPDVLNNSPTIALSPDDVNAIRNGAMQNEMNNSAEMMQNGMGYDDGYNNYNNVQNFNDQGYGNNDINNFNNNDNYNDAGYDNQNYNDNYYDEEEEKVDNKLEKITIIGAVIIVIFIVALIVIILSQINGSDKKEESSASPNPVESQDPNAGNVKVTVPNVKGDTQEEAKKKLDEANLIIKINLIPLTNPAYEGIVTRQDPDADVEVNKFSEINVYIETKDYNKQSKEPELEAKLIDVKGMDLEKAQFEIKKLFTSQNLNFNVQYISSEDVSEGLVIRTEPAANSTIKNTDKITIYVSKGAGNNSVKVPGLIGKDINTAERLLNESGLNIKKETENNSNYQKGQVISQSHAEGSMIPRGSTIIVKYSTYEEPQEKRYTITATLDMRKEDMFNDNLVEGESNIINGSYRINRGGTMVHEGEMTLDGDNYNGFSITFTVNSKSKPKKNEFEIYFSGVTGNCKVGLSEKLRNNMHFSISD